MERRSFLKTAALLPLLQALPSLLLAQDAPTTHGNTLILLELKGGNDGLNTLIPYKHDLYYKQRPTLAIPAQKALPLTDQVALHPALKPLLKLWEHQELAWLQGVGYPNPNRSHFRSIEIWDTAQMDAEVSLEGWVAQTLDQALKGVAIGGSLGPLYSEDLSSIALVNPLQFARLGRRIKASTSDTPNPALQYVLEVQNSVHALAQDFFKQLKTVEEPKIPFPKHRLGRDMAFVYKLQVAGLNIPAYKVSLGGFDTHSNQLGRQQRLFTQLSHTLTILRQNLQAQGLWNNTLIMSYSEFGRRLQENANKGTDHGAAAPHFVLGGAVKGGLYGDYPALDDLDTRGDLKYTLDFRDVYTTLAKKWWNHPLPTDAPATILNFIA